MVEYSRIWLNMVKYGGIWWNMVEYGRMWLVPGRGKFVVHG